ncbi:MAG TPA: peptidoglycan editing factor PgeF [Eubacteriaceae bacterium]|nr:peptidoglycan editing factor PgeF [Eubacteriaceae bacterium]
MSFNKQTKHSLTYYTISSFTDTRLVQHGFTTRLGGFSNYPYHSFNLDPRIKNDDPHVFKNYQHLCDTLSLDCNRMVLSNQIHSDRIRIVQQEDLNHKSEENPFIGDYDAMITNRRNISLVALFADCVPLFFLDPIHKAIGLAHAGWKGTMAHIGAKTLQKMNQAFDTDPKTCLVGIGPSIGPCCFETEKNVVDSIHENYRQPTLFYQKISGKKYLVDLWKLNKASLLEQDVPEKNISVSEICTLCNKDLFFSYRGDQGRTGRMAAFLSLL